MRPTLLVHILAGSPPARDAMRDPRLTTGATA